MLKCWEIDHCNRADSVAFIQPESIFKTYIYRYTVSVDLGEDKSKLIRFMYAMNTNKDETTFELLYHTCDSNDYWRWDEWRPVPAEVFESMFKNKDGDWCFGDSEFTGKVRREHMRVEVVDGHFLFKFSTLWLRNVLGSVSVKSFPYSVPGRLIHEVGDELGIALAYPHRLYTLEETKVILGAFKAIHAASWSLCDENSRTTSTKQRLFDQLEKTQKDLAEYEKKYQEILDNAADAMNLMSSKYGIEIDI